MLPFRCQLPFVSNHLCEQGWILGEANQKQSPRVPLFSDIPRVPFESFALSFCLQGFCQSSTDFTLKRPNKLSLFGHIVQKGRVVNTVSNFDTIARQTTDRSRRKNRFLHCSVKRLMNHFKATF